MTIELERSGSGGDTDRIPATRVHETLSAHMLADGFDLVLDLPASYGRHLVDAGP